MPTELFTPISISEGEEGRNFKRVIDDNFTNLARHLNDVREWIDSSKYREIRNTYVFSDQDSLDGSFPFEIDFEIVSEMTAIQSIKLSFRIRNFRAYATTVPSGGGHTTPSGGGHTTPSGGGHTTPSGGEATSGATGSASGGGSTSGATGSASGGGATSGSRTHDHSGSTAGIGDHEHAIRIYGYTSGFIKFAVDISGGSLQWQDPSNTFTQDITTRGGGSHGHSLDISADGAHTHTTPDHTHPNHTHSTPNHTHPNHQHSTPSHTHAVSNHTHTVSSHTHTVSNHAHSLTFGIYEDSQSPTIHYHIDNGAGYGGASGDYTTDQLDIAITGSISGTGFKRIKFDSDLRCRISAWVLCKIDLTA